jgi:peptidoglycan/LPS O-acetylase OafA/YrhL
VRHGLAPENAVEEIFPNVSPIIPKRVCRARGNKNMSEKQSPLVNHAEEGFPGLDGVRWLAAWAVVFSHSYPIAAGANAMDPLAAFLGEGNSLGNYAVRIFFVLSGFLLSRSLDHPESDPLRFLVHRLLRILPGFCFAVIVTVLLLGPWLSGLSVSELLFSRNTWLSIYWSIVGLGDASSLPPNASRFPELAGFINGSLWSIPYELVCYLFLLALHMLLRKSSKVAVAAGLLGLVSLLAPSWGWTTAHGSFPAAAFPLPFIMLDKTLPYFCGGVAFYPIHKKWPFSGPILALAMTLLLGAARFDLQATAFAFCGPVLAVWLGRWAWLAWPMSKSGDVSYGIYLFGWPVSLCVALKAAAAGPVLVFLASVLPVFLLAWLMRRWVENPVNDRLKPALLRLLPRFAHPSLSGMTPSGLQLLAHRLVYWGFFLSLTRFLVYPWPGSANWFGDQIYQLSGLGIFTGLLLTAAQSPIFVPKPAARVP